MQPHIENGNHASTLHRPSVVVHAAAPLADQAERATALEVYLAALRGAGVRPLLVHAGERALEDAVRRAGASSLRLETASASEAAEVALDLEAIELDCATASGSIETASGTERWLTARRALELIRRGVVARPLIPKLRAAVHTARHGIRSRIGTPDELLASRATTVIARDSQDARDALSVSHLRPSQAARLAGAA